MSQAALIAFRFGLEPAVALSEEVRPQVRAWFERERIVFVDRDDAALLRMTEADLSSVMLDASALWQEWFGSIEAMRPHQGEARVLDALVRLSTCHAVFASCHVTLEAEAAHQRPLVPGSQPHDARDEVSLAQTRCTVTREITQRIVRPTGASELWEQRLLAVKITSCDVVTPTPALGRAMLAHMHALIAQFGEG